MRLTYPSNIRIVKVPCTGRVAIIHLMKALEKELTEFSWLDVWKAIAIFRQAI